MTYIYIYTCICMCVYIYIYAYIYIYIYTHTADRHATLVEARVGPEEPRVEVGNLATQTITIHIYYT